MYDWTGGTERAYMAYLVRLADWLAGVCTLKNCVERIRGREVPGSQCMVLPDATSSREGEKTLTIYLPRPC